MSLVFVPDWQIQCCGEEFGVGDEVDWPVAAIAPGDRSWETFLGAGLTGPLDGRYESHEDPGVVPQVRGTVRAIRTVSSRYAPLPPPADPREYGPVPGTAVVVPVERIEKWYGTGFDPLVLRFNGWLVDLEVTGPGGA